MSKKLFAVAAVFAATWSMSAAATNYSLVCNGCTTEQTREQVLGSRAGDYFVYDVLNRRVTHWQVTGNDPDTNHLTNVAISAAQQDQFNWVQQFYDNLGTLDYEWDTDASNAVTRASVNALHTSTKVMTPLVAEGSAPGSPLSAYDLINTPINQNAAIAAATAGSFWGNAPMKAVTWLASFTSHFSGTQVLYPVPVIISETLHFADGSTAKIHWNVDTDAWQYTLGSAKDATGNPIPENPDQAVGGSIGRQNYIWPDTAQGIADANRASQNFANLGLAVGVPVFNQGNTWTVACVRIGGTTGFVSCTVVHG